jgi:type II secretory pathway pseudopilin PulG
MLVVIGIILLVVGLGMPMAMHAWRTLDRTATYNNLQVIAAGLEAYRADHGDYPRVTVPWTGGPGDYNGARMLCRALIAPGAAGPATATGTPPPAAGPMIYDGKGNEQNPGLPAPGFRLRGAQGRVYGPYIPAERFKTGNPSAPGQLNPDPGYLALLDRYEKPILYYPATGKFNVRADRGYIGDYDPAAPPTAGGRPMFNAHDNIGAMSFATFSMAMGDGNLNSKIDTPRDIPERPLYEGPYMLWSSGPDEKFAIAVLPIPTYDSSKYNQRFEKGDDITNFRQ